MSYTPHPDPAGVLSDNQQRALEREGIPMFLALEDLTGPPAPAKDGKVLSEGAELDRLLGHYARSLAPDAADGDLGQLSSVLTVLARAHFDEEGRA
ncbi:MAG: hypothetical protein HOV96_08625 [Nonomuraea sp.]|nr:hypothetical protein [Nonomuraea sp.]NUP77597.1 hypothetical protein [Nonomuraea sp.]NUS03008.1 hypothetical protein [Nonomuraea sp.]NUT07364.1 hypothetical protein [Hamadaea sp.]